MTGTSSYDTLSPGWTDERVAELRQLWADGLSASQIAVELGGATRNAILGKVNRMKLEARGRGHIVKPRGEPRPKPDKRSHARKPDTDKRAPVRRPPVIEPDDTPLRAAPIECVVPLLDLTEGMCRYPSGDGADIRFCGAPKARGSWCATHAALVYVPLHRRPEGVDYRVKRGDAMNAIRWRQGRGTTQYAAE
ncbi:hypothetical protein CCR97_08145 [Rhodoplanes elegans]|uniref:GcrA cell cycle regulator n=1 Tax=Rhodoplanes elegans TaxID=29408 RepID=A0A327KWP9_9BRAD|nr:GcrA family cell cycle regulator [Rhodoplanes elegans]MBK5958090.1 hypothetical protein [Rhodoplanes elegans]MBK5958182.1 hypothetical protein [Rhodoplanes elegans]RAI41965.1 hypothetical protein CH338_01285 [Rhodoplanes elegans]